MLTQARRFEELSADHQGRDIPELSPLETAVRPLAKLGAAGGGDASILTLERSAPTSAA